MENGKNMGVKFFRTKAFFWDTLISICLSIQNTLYRFLDDMLQFHWSTQYSYYGSLQALLQHNYVQSLYYYLHHSQTGRVYQFLG